MKFNRWQALTIDLLETIVVIYSAFQWGWQGFFISLGTFLVLDFIVIAVVLKNFRRIGDSYALNER